MIDPPSLVKLVHVLSGTVLFGTGLGIAFFMVWATRTRSAPIIAAVARIVVVADFVFTAAAVVIQPLTGLWLIRMQGFGLAEPWLLATYALYDSLVSAGCRSSGFNSGWPDSPPRRPLGERNCRHRMTGSTGSGSPSAGRPSRR